MDDPERMDLPLNADFDSTLLNCWDSGSGKTARRVHGRKSGSPSPPSNHSDGGGASWDGNAPPGFSRLPSFTIEDEATCSQKRVTDNSDDEAAATAAAAAAAGTPSWPELHKQTPQVSSNKPPANRAMSVDAENLQRKASPVPVSTTGSLASASTNGATSKKSLAANGNAKRGSTQQMPSNPQSSVHLSTPGQDSDAMSNSGTTQLHPLAIPSSANCPPYVMQSTAGLQNPSFFPMTWSSLHGNPAAAALAAGFSLQSNQMDNQSANYPCMLFQNIQATTNGGNAPIQQQPQQQTAQPQQPQLQRTQQQQSEQQHTDNSADTNSSSVGSPPPFYLFDAPVELRANFMQSQRMHGLPVSEGNNSYHFGVSVNGFHPQFNAQLDAHDDGGSSRCVGGSQASTSVKLVDGRHSESRKSGRIKNEREQRRAQKITELIEQLREKMETGGWKVEMKSKFHTLSSCADYVKHLIKTTKEKEEAVNKAKLDLQMRERKVEEDKAMQEPRSDPESVMSSLTSSTGESGDSRIASGRGRKVSSEVSSEENGSRKRKSSSGSIADCTANKRNRKNKTSDKHCSESSGEEQGCLTSNGRVGSLDKTASSVSDITDSNKGSSKSTRDTQNCNQRLDEDDESGTPSSLSASSSAAVVKGHDRSNPHTRHADVVVKGRHVERKHKPSSEATSMEESFVLDYEEVFLKSNVPQVLATTAGRIVAWNDFFLKATGILRSGAKGLTIFSLVKQEKLSNLFEIVAKALRKDPPSSVRRAKDKESENAEGPQWDYEAMTLPCIEFPLSKEHSERGKLADPLYITVTLMYDEDPRKRLFHCVFTDCPGTNGALGSVTPDLLSTLFTSHHHMKKNDSDARKLDKSMVMGR